MNKWKEINLFQPTIEYSGKLRLWIGFAVALSSLKLDATLRSCSEKLPDHFWNKKSLGFAITKSN